MSEISDYMASQNTGRLFVILLLVFAFLVLIAYITNKENRDKMFDSYRAACDAEKQGLQNFAMLAQNQANNTAQIKELINTTASASALASANDKYANLLQQYNQMMFNNGQAISGLSNKLNLTETECDLKAILARKANAPFTAAVSAMFPPFVVPSNGTTTGGTEGAA